MNITTTLKKPFSSTPILLNETQNETQVSKKSIVIFCIDEHPLIQHLVKNIFETENTVQVYYFEDASEALKRLDLKPEIIMLNYKTSNTIRPVVSASQQDLFEKTKAFSPLSKLIILSNQREASIAVNCLKKGAVDYILKDEHMKFHIKKSVDNIIKKMAVQEEILILAQKIKRDKLLLKGYFCIALIALATMLTYLL